ncbi:MAG: VWA domain-containing protein [Desertimonas sp.]
MLAIDFMNAGRLWWLLAVAALAGAYVVILRWRRSAAVRFTQVELLDEIAPQRPGWRRHVVAALQLAGLSIGVVAMARPFSTQTERTESEGRIIVAFDVSLSMEADDVEPTRLDAAKEAATAFVERVDPAVEVGLVSFAGTVTVDVPPTLDRTRVERAIAGLDLDESTAIGDALATSTELLVSLADTGDGEDGGDDELAPGAIVLLTDGETTVGQYGTAEGGQIAAEAGVPVFTIAFGTVNGTIEDPDTGDIIPVPVFPQPLEDVAEVTGGASYEAASENELNDVYEGIRDILGDTLGEEIEVTTEHTWKWTAWAIGILAAAWALALWWLRGLV